MLFYCLSVNNEPFFLFSIHRFRFFRFFLVLYAVILADLFEKQVINQTIILASAFLLYPQERCFCGCSSCNVPLSFVFIMDCSTRGGRFRHKLWRAVGADEPVHRRHHTCERQADPVAIRSYPRRCRNKGRHPNHRCRPQRCPGAFII